MIHKLYVGVFKRLLAVLVLLSISMCAITVSGGYMENVTGGYYYFTVNDTVKIYLDEICLSVVGYERYPAETELMELLIPNKVNPYFSLDGTDNHYDAEITCIAEDAFLDCIFLQKVVIEEGITTIGDGAFAGCTNLEELRLPSTVQNISIGMFVGESTNYVDMSKITIYGYGEQVKTGAENLGCSFVSLDEPGPSDAINVSIETKDVDDILININPDNTGASGQVILGTYASDGSLLDIILKDEWDGVTTEMTVENAITRASGASFLRCFLWKDLENSLEPLCAPSNKLNLSY